MRDRAEIEADCREPSVICCATHARLLDDVPALLAALDEANADRQRLAAENERISGAWRQVILREQRSDNAHDYDIRQIEAERDRALAAIQRVEALCDKWASGGNWDVQIAEADIHAALAGPQNGGSE
jgi:hypothetical protein